jgi:endonuclease/exonuclease/phosphatase family metal-dependent hydrolase
MELLFFMILLFLPLNALTQMDSLKVMSWNVFLRPGILSDGQMDRVSDIGGYLIRHGGDVIVLQEVFHKRARKRLLQKLDGCYDYHTSIGPRSFFGVSSGVMIFSKHPIIEEKFVSYSKSKGADGLAKKGAVLATIRIGKQDVHIVGTHLQAGASSAAKRVQKSQLTELANAVNFIEDSSIVIFAGDFNITPDEKLFAYLSSSLEVELPDLSPPFSATANFVGQDLFPAEGEPVWIDYVFLKTTTRAKQKSTWIEDWFSKNLERFSDHDMIYSVFEIKGNNKELYD